MTKYKFDCSDKAIYSLIHDTFNGHIRPRKYSTPNIINIIEALKIHCKTRHTWKITEIRQYCKKMNLSITALQGFYKEYEKRKKPIFMLKSILDKEIEKQRGYFARRKMRTKNEWDAKMMNESEYKPLVTHSNKDLNEFITGVIKLKRDYFPKTKDLEVLKILWSNIESEKKFTSFNDFKRFYYDNTQPEKRRKINAGNNK